MRRLGPIMLTLSLMLGGGLFAATGGSAASDVVPTGAPRVATFGPSPAADTLEYSVTAGDAFITDLPATLREQPVESYAIVDAPSMSWLVDRSFFWRTDQAEPGRHTVRLRATIADAPPDTLALLITVSAP
jgi:hypothetical protein